MSAGLGPPELPCSVFSSGPFGRPSRDDRLASLEQVPVVADCSCLTDLYNFAFLVSSVATVDHCCSE